MLTEIIAGRAASIDAKVEAGLGDTRQAALLKSVLASIGLVIVVNTQADKSAVVGGLEDLDLERTVEVISLDEVRRDLEALASIVA